MEIESASDFDGPLASAEVLFFLKIGTVLIQHRQSSTPSMEPIENFLSTHLNKSQKILLNLAKITREYPSKANYDESRSCYHGNQETPPSNLGYQEKQVNIDSEDPQQEKAWADAEHTYEDHMYTSALKEIGDIEGVSPTYTLNRLSLEPSKWGATAQYKQFKSFSEGSSKRVAKHSASKALWLKIGKGAIL
ncbi:hypothetical protein N7476_001811 [Penicillium atrosanguineum]|uniref:Uncharacterized protein n=1 Tax=Penicillium atrosanguineum TaxID=1132637 RepID=A0A9W9Q6A9_9EURO|nr:hypothetical protein N7476_001811 [Penicillium atrosanguineum]